MNRSLIFQVTVWLLCGAFVAWQVTQYLRLESEATALTLDRGPAGPLTAAPLSAVTPTEPNAEQESAEAGTAPKTIDMASDLKAILAQPDPMTRMREMLDYVQGLSSDQLGAALEELRAGAPEWDPEVRLAAHMLLTRWGQEDPDAAFASLVKMDYRKSGGDASSILSSLAAVDPERAAEWLNDPDNALKYRSVMGHILSGTIAKEWARQDPQAAFDWAADLPREQRAGAFTGLLGTMAATDPRGASALAMDLEPGRERGRIIRQIASAWAKKSPAEALSWAESFEGRERDHAVGQVVDSWAKDEPYEAASYVELLEGSESGGHTARVAANWAQQSPEAAAGWLSTRPEGGGKDDAMGRVMWHWTTTDPVAASTWLAEQPAGQSRDIGAAALAKAAFNEDPEGAVSWATTISDEKMRGAMVAGGLEHWVERDAAAARDWASANGVALPSPKKEQESK